MQQENPTVLNMRVIWMKKEEYLNSIDYAEIKCFRRKAITVSKHWYNKVRFFYISEKRNKLKSKTKNQNNFTFWLSDWD